VVTRTRRGVLAAVAGVVLAGCLGGGDGGATTTVTGTPTPSPSPTPTPEPTATPTATPDTGACDPSAVTRPAVATDSAVGGQSYPSKPESLTEASVAEYLSEFETAYAWNRAVGGGSVTGVNVDTLDGFLPDVAGEGYLAGSRMRVTVTDDEAEATERAYVASYYVAPAPTDRVETPEGRVDPRDRTDRTLVACGTGDGTK
jgi:hypothetical protein